MSELLQTIKKDLASLFGLFKGVISSAYTWVIIMAMGGVSSICYGVFMVANLGLSLIVLGTFLLLFMALIARGAANG